MADTDFAPSDEFKETEIGPIPTDWDIVPLDKATEHRKNTINPQSYPDEVFDYYSIPAYQISTNPVLEHGSKIRSQKLIVETNMVLFGKLNPRVPKVWLVTSPSARRKIASTEFIPLVSIDGKTSDEFLYYLAWSDFVLPKSQELVSGSTPSRQRVDVKAFLQVPIPLPPLPEQRRIAHVLSTIQREITTQDDLIAAAREVKRSLMQRLFTYGPGVEPVATKETEIGEVPEHWDVVQLGDVTESSAFGPRFSGKLYDESGNIATLRTTDLDANGNINYYTMPRARLKSEKFKKHFLLPEDFLVTRSGTCGIAAVFESHHIPVLPGAFLIRFRLRDRIKPLFLREYFNSDLGKLRVSLLASGAVQKNISGTALRAFQIPLPHLDEQQKIIRIGTAIDCKIAAEEDRKAALQALFKSMLHQLMSGQIRLTDSELWRSQEV